MTSSKLQSNRCRSGLNILQVFHSHVDLKLAPTDVETAINKSKQTQVRQRMNRLVDTRAQDGPKRRKISTALSPAAQTSHPNTVKYTTPGPMGPVMKISEEIKPDDGSIWALVYCPGYGRFFAPDDTLVRMLPTKQVFIQAPIKLVSNISCHAKSPDDSGAQVEVMASAAAFVCHLAVEDELGVKRIRVALKCQIP